MSMKIKSFLERARNVMRRGQRLARRVSDPVPLTPLGLAALVGGGASLYFLGIKRVDLVVLAMSVVAVAVAVLCLLAVSITAVVLKLAMRRSIDEASGTRSLECGFATRLGFSVSSLWWVPFVTVSWRWVSPRATVRLVRERRRLHEECIPTRRGMFEQVERRIEVSDPFGFARCAFRVIDPRAVRALPSVGALKRVEVVRTLSPGEDISDPRGGPDGERSDMRAYAPGDPIKFVLWKVFARSGDLVLRSPERAFSPAKQTTAYLVAGAGDEAAAGLARLLVETNSLGTRWVLGADGSDEDARGGPQAMELIARSGMVPAEQGAAGLGKFLERHATGGGRVVVIVPGVPGPWLDRARAAVGRAGQGRVEVFVCIDGVTPESTRSALARVLFDEARPAAEALATEGEVLPSRAELRAVCDALAGSRAAVTIVDRRAGRVFGDAHRRALEAA
jgi:hypothetical protein